MSCFVTRDRIGRVTESAIRQYLMSCRWLVFPLTRATDQAGSARQRVLINRAPQSCQATLSSANNCAVRANRQPVPGATGRMAKASMRLDPGRGRARTSGSPPCCHRKRQEAEDALVTASSAVLVTGWESMAGSKPSRRGLPSCTAAWGPLVSAFLPPCAQLLRFGASTVTRPISGRYRGFPSEGLHLIPRLPPPADLGEGIEGKAGLGAPPRFYGD